MYPFFLCSSFCLVRTNPEGRVFYVAIFITTVLFHLLLCVCVMCRFSSRSGSKTTEHAPKNNERTRKNKRRIYEKKKKTANRGLDKQTTRKEDQIKTGSIKCCPFFSVSAIVSQCVCDWHPSFFVRPVRWHVLEADTPDAYTLAVPWCLTVIWARLLDEQHSSQQRSPAQSLLLFIFVSPFCRHSGWWLSYFSLSAPLSLPDHDDDRSGSNSKCHVGLFLFLAGRSVVKREHKIK